MAIVSIRAHKPKKIHLDRGTTYNTEISQCDNDPFHTADGSYINRSKLSRGIIRWVALSRDLICDKYRRINFPAHGHWNGLFRFGDTIKVRSRSNPHLNGEWVVHDCMNSRYSNSIDFLFDPRNNRPKLGVCTDVKIIYEGKDI